MFHSLRSTTVPGGANTPWRHALGAAVLSVAMVTASASSALAAERYKVKAKPRKAPGALAASATDAKGNLTYAVQRGDSLSKVAVLYGFDELVGWRVLYDANTKIDNPNLIDPGDVINVPEHGEVLKRRSVPTPAPAPETASSAASTVTASASDAQPVTSPAPPGPATGGVWDRLARCESGGNWQANTGNGYYGGLQFSLSSWHAAGGSGYPHQASKGEQIARAEQLLAVQGWGAWPACSAELGLGG